MLSLTAGRVRQMRSAARMNVQFLDYGEDVFELELIPDGSQPTYASTVVQW
jgi:hypothetical protein